MGQLNMLVQAGNGCCHTTPPLRGGPERQWGRRILPKGRSLDGALSHPLYVDNKVVSCKEIHRVMGSDK